MWASSVIIVLYNHVPCYEGLSRYGLLFIGNSEGQILFQSSIPGMSVVFLLTTIGSCLAAKFIQFECALLVTVYWEQYLYIYACFYFIDMHSNYVACVCMTNRCMTNAGALH